MQYNNHHQHIFFTIVYTDSILVFHIAFVINQY